MGAIEVAVDWGNATGNGELSIMFMLLDYI